MKHLVSSIQAILADKEVDTHSPLVADDVLMLLTNDTVPKLLKDVTLPMGGTIILFSCPWIEGAMFSIVWDKKIIDFNLVINGEHRVILDCPSDAYWFEPLNNKSHQIVSNLF